MILTTGEACLWGGFVGFASVNGLGLDFAIDYFIRTKSHGEVMVFNILKLFSIIIFVQLLLLPVGGITWQEVLVLARQNSYDLKSSASQTEAARWSYYRSFTPYLPKLSASASYGQTTAGTAGAVTDSSSYSLNITQTLFSGFENYFGALSAKANYDYYVASQQKAESDLYLQVRQSFIDLAIADEYIALLKNILERRKSNSALVELRYESGREDKGALLRTQADLADAEYNVAAAERTRSLAKLKLSQLISAEVDKIEDKLEVKIPPQPDYNTLLLNTPSYIMYLKQLEKAELALKQTASEFLPSISLSGSYRKSGTSWPPVSESNSWSLNFSYSLFPGGSNVADRIIYSTQYEKARQDFLKSRDNLRYALESAYEQLKDAVEALKIAELSLNAASLRAEIAQAKYMNGLINYDEWDRIENDYISARKNLLSSKKAALYAEAAWHNSYGGYVQ